MVENRAAHEVDVGKQSLSFNFPFISFTMTLKKFEIYLAKVIRLT